jgi:glycosyltransferase involved in cell wall biosynthesis
MPFYNAARYLKQSVESILNQTFRDFEFILIDDGSTDGSYEIASNFKDPRIVLHRQDNQGLTRSLNRALAMVSPDAEFVARMDADDWSYPARFERQVRFLEAHRAIAGVGCWYELVDETGKIIEVVCPNPAPSSVRRSLCWDIALVHPSLIVRRDILKRVGGYDERYRYAQDRDLLLRMARHYAVSLVPEVLLKYRQPGTCKQHEIEQKRACCRVLCRAICRGDCSAPGNAVLLLLRYALTAYLPKNIIRLQRTLWCRLGLRDTVGNDV